MSDFIEEADKANQTKQKGIIAWFAYNHVAANLLMIFILVAGFFSYQNLNKKNTFNSITWYFIDGNNILLYHTGLGENNFRLWQVGFPGQNFASATGTDFPISVRAKPSQPKLSPSGKWVAFSMEGDIWLASISGTSTTPLSFGKSRDSSPDWASETEIIFTRSEFPHSSRELWSLQVSNPP